jgi:hypothetical protein
MGNRRLQYGEGTKNIHRGIEEWFANAASHFHLRSVMIDNLRSFRFEDRIHKLCVSYVAQIKTCLGIEIVPRPTGQIIDNGHVVPGSDIPIRDVRANKPRPASYQYAQHRFRSFQR